MNVENYYQFLTLFADLSAILPDRQVDPSGRIYYRIKYEVVILFGLTELEAYIQWLENVRMSRLAVA